MFPQFIPYQDPKTGKWNLGFLGGSGYISTFEEATTTDITQTFDWSFNTGYIPQSGTGAKVSTKNPTTGEIKSAFSNELQKLLVVDANGNLGVEKKDKIKLDKILEGAGKVLDLGSKVWDIIDPSRVAKRTAVIIPNNETGDIVETNSDIVPVNRSTNTTGKNPITPPPAAGFDFTKFLSDNIYFVAIILILVVYFFFPSGETNTQNVVKARR